MNTGLLPSAQDARRNSPVLSCPNEMLQIIRARNAKKVFFLSPRASLKKQFVLLSAFTRLLHLLRGGHQDKF